MLENKNYFKKSNKIEMTLEDYEELLRDILARNEYVSMCSKLINYILEEKVNESKIKLFDIKLVTDPKRKSYYPFTPEDLAEFYKLGINEKWVRDFINDKWNEIRENEDDE